MVALISALITGDIYCKVHCVHAANEPVSVVVASVEQVVNNKRHMVEFVGQLYDWREGMLSALPYTRTQ